MFWAGCLADTNLLISCRQRGLLFHCCSCGWIVKFVIFDGNILIYSDHLIYIDALGAFNIMLIAMVGFAAAVYSVGYMRYEVAEEIITRVQLGRYYFFSLLYFIDDVG